MPSTTQAKTIGSSAGTTTYVSSFSPILGGAYRNSALTDEATRGHWWGSEKNNGFRRNTLRYEGSDSLYIGNRPRFDGLYIRCINKQKTVLDLTYIWGNDVGDWKYGLCYVESFTCFE